MPVVINRTLSQRSFADINPIGQRLLIEDDPVSGVRRAARIIGVASDIKTNRLTEDPHPVVFRPSNSGVLLVRLAATPTMTVMQNVQQVVELRAPETIVRVFHCSRSRGAWWGATSLRIAWRAATSIRSSRSAKTDGRFSHTEES